MEPVSYSEREPKQVRAKETQKKIINAALKLFSEKGYYKTNSKEIAKEAGVSIGTFYIYYKEKKPLLLEVFSTIYREIADKVFNEELLQKFEGLNIEQTIDLMIDLLYQSHNIAPGFHREAIAMIYSDPDIRKINLVEEERVISFLISLLSLYREDLRVVDFEAAARVIHKAAKEVIHSIKIFGSPISEERLLGGLKEMICSYLILEQM